MLGPRSRRHATVACHAARFGNAGNTVHLALREEAAEAQRGLIEEFRLMPLLAAALERVKGIEPSS